MFFVFLSFRCCRGGDPQACVCGYSRIALRACYFQFSTFNFQYYLCLVDSPPPLDELPLDDVPLLDELEDDLETLELLLAGGLLLCCDGLLTFCEPLLRCVDCPDDCLDAGLLNSLLDLDDGVVAGW